MGGQAPDLQVKTNVLLRTNNATIEGVLKDLFKLFLLFFYKPEELISSLHSFKAKTFKPKFVGFASKILMVKEFPVKSARISAKEI